MQPQRDIERAAGPADVMSYGAGQAIRQHAALSGEDKWAWRFLWLRSRGGRELVHVTPTEIAADQGVSETSGRRRIESLAGKHGLIAVLHTCSKTGRRTIQVFDPRDVLGVVAPDPQPTLFDDRNRPLSESQLIGSGDAPRRLKIIDASAAEPPADALAEPPAEASPRASGPLGPSAPSVPRFDHSRPSTIGSPSGPSREVSTAKDQGRDGTAGGSVTTETAELGDLSRQLAARRREQGIEPEAPLAMELRTAAAIGAAMASACPSPAEQARRREQWIETIGRRVRDPQLKTCVKVKVAAAVVAGELKPAAIEEVFAELDNHRRNGTLRATPGIYFLRACQALFRRAGIEWRQPQLLDDGRERSQIVPPTKGR